MTEPDSEPGALLESVLEKECNDSSAVVPPGEVAPAPQGHRHTNSILFVCNFLSKGWEVAIIGLLIFIQNDYQLHHSYKMPMYMVGILPTVFIVSQISISLFAGKIAHALHSRNVIFLAIISSALAWITMFLSDSLPALFLAYTFGGISSGLFEPIGNSLVAKCSASKNRNTAIGNFAAFGDMGKISVVAAATALAGLLGVGNTYLVLFTSAAIALILAIIFIPHPKKYAAESAAQEIPVQLRDLLKNVKFCMATAAGIADSFSSASLYIFIPFLLTGKGIDLDKTLYFNVIFFVGYMSGRLALGRLADKHGAPNILMWSKVAMAALIIVLIFAEGSVVLGLLLFLLGIFTRGSSPIIRAMVADAMHEKTSFHDAFAVYSFASRSSSAVCRPIYGFLASLTGISSVFYASSVVSLLTLYPAARYKTAPGHAGPIPGDDAVENAATDEANVDANPIDRLLGDVDAALDKYHADDPAAPGRPINGHAQRELGVIGVTALAEQERNEQYAESTKEH